MGISVWDFEFIRPLGKGAFGRVYLTKRKATGDLYAMKIVDSSNKVTDNGFLSIEITIIINNNIRWKEINWSRFKQKEPFLEC